MAGPRRFRLWHRAALRGEHRQAGNERAAHAAPKERAAALDRVAATVTAVRAGEGATARLAATQLQGQRRGMRI